MKRRMTAVTAAVIALLIFVPATYAQTPESSILPVTEPLDVGGTVLQPGEYLIRVIPSRADRNKIQITSRDMKTVYATVLTVPHHLEPGEEVPNTMFVYFPAENGAPRALRTWFAPNPEASQGGHDIVYEESRARQLARLASEPVPSVVEDTAVADFDTTTVTVIEPEPVVETPAPTVVETAPVEPEPMISSEPEQETPDMPRTASRIPLVALLGLASLAVAVVIRVARA